MWFWTEIGLVVIAAVLAALLVRYMIKWPYELRIGWRYLYGGRRDRIMALCAAGSGIVALIGLVQMLLSHGGVPSA